MLTEEQKLLRQSDKARMTEAEFKHTWEGGLLGSGRLVCPVFDEKVHVKEFDWNKIRSRANFFLPTRMMWLTLRPKECDTAIHGLNHVNRLKTALI